jgi:DUF917 family protein
VNDIHTHEEHQMADGGLFTREDIEDFGRGTDFLSASGGGAPVESTALLVDDLDRNVAIRWSELAQLPDDALVVSTFFSGSIAPESWDPAEVAATNGVSRRVERPLVEAVRELEEHLGRSIDAIISVEIGGFNSGHTVDAAANLGKTLLDADYAGRAIPEVDCVTPAIFGEQMAPFSAVDYYGDVSLVKRAGNNRMAERLGKYIASAAFGLVGCAAIPLPGAAVKRLAVPGTLSEALAIGRAIRAAQGAGGDPIPAIAASTPGGRVLFRGEVSGRSWENREGYMWGEHEISGDRGFGGTLRVWFKNENHVSWLDGAPFVMSPDVIEFVDDATGEPRVNTDIAIGDRIAVIGVPRRPQYDTPEGIGAMGPRHWGFDIDFQPMESFDASRG